jgi:hypothetical protein
VTGLNGVEIVDSYYFGDEPGDDDIDQVLIRFKAQEPDALAYCGFGFHSRTLNPALARVGWQPPKAMSAAIMWALASPEWADALDGWVGIEQTNGDHEQVEKNPNWTDNLPAALKANAMKAIKPGDPGNWELVLQGDLLDDRAQAEDERLKIVNPQNRYGVMREEGIGASASTPTTGLYVWLLTDGAVQEASCASMTNGFSTPWPCPA